MTQGAAGMFRKLGLIAAALAMVAVSAAWAADASPRATIKLQYVAPEKFTDFGDNGYVTTDERRDAMLAQLKRHIEDRAALSILPGVVLSIAITDVGMAGSFEWWRGPRADHARIVKDVYPPRIKLEFSLAGADGRVIVDGRRDLTDLAFMTNMGYRGDLLRYEKKLLDDWLVREFASQVSRQAENR